MIAVDTNVLARFLVRDDTRQYREAEAFFRSAGARRESILVTDIVLAELVWILQRGYGFERREIADVVERLASSSNIALEDHTTIGRAVVEYRKGPGGFADYLIAERAEAAGCRLIVTFDRRLRRNPRFIAPAAF